MKAITIAGRSTKAAELRRTQNGDAVLSFSVAVDDGYGQNKGTIYFDCSVWGKRGQSLEQHIQKGTPITVNGELGKREHDGKTYLTIRVNDVTLQGSGQRAERKAESHDYEDDRTANLAELDDEIPF